ncbi:hypothetical protein [Cellulomonas aerilata]|uniref:Uncharacterized protein n=1 Tax=Cellulomonas aerilata TaxID=515326 RepID=A0A512D9I8_9CELL|nr:hypothetical protein [Cellulomonas aerilata]GEO33152.1 hypothetical protein CAE01nite_08770 [Cellulomonas aerilata]
MSTTRIHSCIYFDDGVHHTCSCGSRAMFLVEDDGHEPVLVMLHDDGAAPETAERLVRELAISA